MAVEQAVQQLREAIEARTGGSHDNQTQCKLKLARIENINSTSKRRPRRRSSAMCLLKRVEETVLAVFQLGGASIP